jgi:hypothetical protein
VPIPDSVAEFTHPLSPRLKFSAYRLDILVLLQVKSEKLSVQEALK